MHLGLTKVSDPESLLTHRDMKCIKRDIYYAGRLATPALPKIKRISTYKTVF